ncbi:MAG: hypothetical protein VZR73_06765 [Acutalibacteraceae bacterium]|nr:hypothetical protein [Acutalibacteraceae bacterium]
MTYTFLQTTNDPRQVFTTDIEVDGVLIHTKFEIRYLSAPNQWVISIWDNSTGDLLVNKIPLICSYGKLNDLLTPFRHIRNGAGIGSLFVLRNTDEPSSADPAKGNLTEFNILIGDTYDGSQS